MSKPVQLVDLAITYANVEGDRIQATIPAVPGTISVGRTRTEARENALDALREMLSVPPQRPDAGVAVERVRLRIDVADRDLGRGI